MFSNVKTYIMSKEKPNLSIYLSTGGGRVVRLCWVNFQCRGVLQFGL